MTLAEIKNTFLAFKKNAEYEGPEMSARIKEGAVSCLG